MALYRGNPDDFLKNLGGVTGAAAVSMLFSVYSYRQTMDAQQAQYAAAAAAAAAQARAELVKAAARMAAGPDNKWGDAEDAEFVEVRAPNAMLDAPTNSL